MGNSLLEIREGSSRETLPRRPHRAGGCSPFSQLLLTWLIVRVKTVEMAYSRPRSSSAGISQDGIKLK
ncbi:hypothetical protein H6P81_003852 [Aristolochia fimbriata]|uniref:Uncharacterized protein n=1 Tax=Aristolochia fimbriata TaxID=158543 RepID=A0AAV7FE95_ARIFI|nr:hypothetical protein H6P81_003852 [Aristolochia fimbriata]